MWFAAAFAELMDNALDEVYWALLLFRFYVSTFLDMCTYFSFKKTVLAFSLIVPMSFWYQVRNGATFVNIDMLVNKKDGSKMLLIEGNVFFCQIEGNVVHMISLLVLLVPQVLNRKERVPLCGLQYLVLVLRCSEFNFLFSNGFQYPKLCIKMQSFSKIPCDHNFFNENEGCYIKKYR